MSKNFLAILARKLWYSFLLNASMKSDNTITKISSILMATETISNHKTFTDDEVKLILSFLYWTFWQTTETIIKIKRLTLRAPFTYGPTCSFFNFSLCKNSYFLNETLKLPPQTVATATGISKFNHLVSPTVLLAISWHILEIT